MQMQPRVLLFSTSNYLSGIKTTLANTNVGLTKACNIDELLSIANKEAYDLFILDSSSEQELIGISEKIRNFGPNANTPILYLSTKKISLEKTFLGYEAAPILSVVKPFSPKDLTNSINLLVTFKKQRDDLLEKNWKLEKAVRENEEKAQLIEEQRMQLFDQAKLSSLGEMAGGMAHEINTPLAVILLRVEQMEQCLIDGDLQGVDFANGLEVIKKITERIAKIISGLRSFAHDGRHDLPRAVKISKLIEDTTSFCKERLLNHEIQLDVEKNVAFDSLEIECREVEISQVILNLLNNAYDAIESLKKRWVRIGVTDLGDYVELSCTDSGMGIHPEIQAKMMQPFFTTKDVGKGPGLGLSISRGIVEAHLGKLYLDQTSLNTKFVMLIPKCQMATDSLKNGYRNHNERVFK